MFDCGFTKENNWFRYRAAAIIVENDYVFTGKYIHIMDEERTASFKILASVMDCTACLKQLGSLVGDFYLEIATIMRTGQCWDALLAQQ